MRGRGVVAVAGVVAGVAGADVGVVRGAGVGVGVARGSRCPSWGVCCRHGVVGHGFDPGFDDLK